MWGGTSCLTCKVQIFQVFIGKMELLIYVCTCVICDASPPQDYGGMLVCRAQSKAACPKVRSSEDVVLNQVVSLYEVVYIGKYQPGEMAN